MSKLMLFLGPELLYLLYICHVVNTLSAPIIQGGRSSLTNDKLKPQLDHARESIVKVNAHTSYRAIFDEYPTIDKISRTSEDYPQSSSNDIMSDTIPQNNQNVSLKYALHSPANSPVLISDSNLDATSENEKMELHTNNHQSVNNHLSRHYNNYYSGSGPNTIYYSRGSNNHKYSALHHSNSNALANSLSLNYIHSLLLSKPSGGSNSLSNLLNFNANSLGLTTSPYGSQSNYGHSSLNSIHQPLPVKHSTIAPVVTTTLPSPSGHNEIFEPTSLNSIDLPVSHLSCGKQQVSAREPRIVGGNSTYEGEFPWAVSIQRQGNHHCGGVIVGKRWILTAAHCVRSQLVGNLIVRTGGHTLTRSINHINSHLSRDYLVDQIVVHDDFSRYDNLTASQMKSSANTNNADIALLKLKNDIFWNELAWPVCFPNADSGNFSGHDATVIGWGKLNEKSEDFSNELQKVRLTIIDNKVCQNWFRQAGRDMPIDDRIICAGFKNGGKDACHGDSGGPLLSKINGHYTVVGVVSTGIGCARPLLPGLYSRVSSYIRWIEKYVS